MGNPWWCELKIIRSMDLWCTGCLILIHSQIPSRTRWNHFRYSHRYPSLALRNRCLWHLWTYEKVSALSRFQRTMLRIGKGHLVIILRIGQVEGNREEPKLERWRKFWVTKKVWFNCMGILKIWVTARRFLLLGFNPKVIRPILELHPAEL